MGKWGRLPPDEIEARRVKSVEALKNIERAEFIAWHQKQCDTQYWRDGQCCAGCDYWSSEMGRSGECQQGGIVSGHDVLKSMGWYGFSSYVPPPGYPMTKDDHWCSNFKDDFDWASLPLEYLQDIGAYWGGELRPKPTRTANQDERG